MSQSKYEEAKKLFHDLLLEIEHLNKEITEGITGDYDNLIDSNRTLSNYRAELFEDLVDLFFNINTNRDQLLKQIEKLEQEIRD